VTINSLPLAPAAGMPDPVLHAVLFDGVLWRRSLAYLIDAVCIGVIVAAAWVAYLVLTMLTLGLLWPAVWLLGLIPLAYHTLLVGGPRAATLGMRALDLQLRALDGERPVFLQALAHTVLFYLTVGPSCFLVLLFALFNRRQRTLHDVLSGMLMVRRGAAALVAPMSAVPGRS
jgi:uncharacterized RDD family membrane protein YckC